MLLVKENISHGPGVCEVSTLSLQWSGSAFFNVHLLYNLIISIILSNLILSKLVEGLFFSPKLAS